MVLMICIIHVCRVTRILVMLMEKYTMHAKHAIISSPKQVFIKIQVTLISLAGIVLISVRFDVALLIRRLPNCVARRGVAAHQNRGRPSITTGCRATNFGRGPPDHLRVMTGSTVRCYGLERAAVIIFLFGDPEFLSRPNYSPHRVVAFDHARFLP